MSPLLKPPSKPAESLAPSNQNPRLDERVSAALQDQLKCEGPPEPGKALRALKSMGFIGAKPKEVVDGMTVWSFVKPVTIFGYKAVHITGWEDKPDGVFFWRAPGTAPGSHLTVVVEGDAKVVDAYMKRTVGETSRVERDALNTNGKPTAAITCYSR